MSVVAANLCPDKEGRAINDAVVCPEEHTIINAEFTSVWDGGNECITTNCKVNLHTKEVFDIAQSDYSGDLDILDGEYVTIYGRDCPVVPESEYSDDESIDTYWYR